MKNQNVFVVGVIGLSAFLLLAWAKVGRKEIRRVHKQHREDLLDRALEESFPASDPVSVNFT